MSRRCVRASSLVWATFIGLVLSIIAFRNSSIFFSTSKISCCILCKCICSLPFVSRTSAALLAKALLVLLQASQISVAHILIKLSMSDLICVELLLSLCEYFTILLLFSDQISDVLNLEVYQHFLHFKCLDNVVSGFLKPTTQLLPSKHSCIHDT